VRPADSTASTNSSPEGGKFGGTIIAESFVIRSKPSAISNDPYDGADRRVLPDRAKVIVFGALMALLSGFLFYRIFDPQA
jgi:hypothetical protein